MPVVDPMEELRTLRTAIDAVGGTPFEWWVDTGVLRFGDGCCALLGYRPGELAETIACWIALLHADDREAVLGQLVAKLASGEDRLELEFRLQRGDDRWRWYAARCRCVARDDDGTPRQLVGMLLDIDALKRTEQAQLRLAELYALRGAVNRAVAHSTDSGQLFARVEQIVVELGGFARATCVLGDARAEDARSFPLRRQGRVVGALCVVPPTAGFFEADRVTALEAVAQEVSFALDAFAREAARAELSRIDRTDAMARLTGRIVHDCNNLLSVVLSYSRMILAEMADGDGLRDDVTEIHRAGERGAAFTRQLLAFSRQRVVESRVFDLNDFVAGMEPMARRVMGDKIEVSVRLAAAALPIQADPAQIEQAVLNLLVNARDAMPDGGTVTLATTRGEQASRPGPQAVLSVADTGVGMGEETRARLFEPFFTRKERAAGLGLATVFGIVRQAGGWVFVDSEEGKGATFRVHLPLAARGEHGTETVLLVEDEDSVRTLVRTLLRRQGYEVLEAAGGVDALAAATRHGGDIHLLLTDVAMPGMGGAELARRMATLRPGIKVLFMSGYAGEAERFLQKPITPGTLLQRVREVLDER